MRCVASGDFELGIPAPEAIGLFTPEGERSWVPGWNPIYADEPSESPGTVFTTVVEGIDTIWLVLEIDRAEGAAAYARVTPSHHAGTVRVRCADADGGRCRVFVTYDLSPLPGAESNGLSAYDEAPFAAMMGEWARAITAALGDPHQGHSRRHR